MIHCSSRWHYSSILLGVLFIIFLNGCSQTVIGKANLTDDNNPPIFLKVGETTVEDILTTLGEPLGYREQDNLSAMIYIQYESQYAFLYYADINMEKAYRLDLVFEDKILQKVEVKKEGWGYGANINTILTQLLNNPLIIR